MQLFFQSLVIFFGTMLAAALVALGEPAALEVGHSAPAPASQQVELHASSR